MPVTFGQLNRIDKVFSHCKLSAAMLKNYLTASLRSLWKNKGFSTINIAGLAMGIATCLLIILYITDETGFDSYNSNAGRIYRVNNEVKLGDNRFDMAQAPGPQGPAIIKELPQVEQYTRFRWHGSLLVKKGRGNFRETRVVYADSTLLQVFSLQLVSGNPGNILKAPQTLLITESMAKKYFGRTNVAGETLVINNNSNYIVSGVIRDVPRQSHFNYDFFVAMSEDADSRDEQGWLSENYNTYILLREGVDAGGLTPAMDKMMYRHVAPVLKSVLNTSVDDFIRGGGYIRNTLTPVTDIHLHSNRLGELSANGSISYIYIFGAIAVFILLVACANFMNLSTARASGRAKEVGVRKVLGSQRKSLIFQFLTESMLVSFTALVLALLLAMLLLPWFNNLAGKQIRVAVLFQPSILLSAVLLMLAAGALAGSYPAFFLSGFKPIDVLKGKLAGGFKGSRLRNTLVVFQFTTSIILICGTLVIYSQLQYMHHKDIGFNRDKLLTIENTGSLQDRAMVLKDQLLKTSGISQATMTDFLPVNGNRNSNAFFTSAVLNGQTPVIMQQWAVDQNYLPALGIELAAGRNFSPALLTDSGAVIINEVAAAALGGGNLLDKKIYYVQDAQAKKTKELHIIGIIKSFHFNSLRDMVTPLALCLGNDNGSITVRLSANDIPGVLAQVKNKWQAMAPTEPFTYSFMDEMFNNQYFAEQRMGNISITFATLAIMIACLGLFGLAAYASGRRAKEIGIRKVLGATSANIAGMLSKSFLQLVLAASLIAFPVAWWAMHHWLQGFAYHISISWWMFAVAGGAALMIALLTVGYQAVKAALANPVRSLRAE